MLRKIIVTVLTAVLCLGSAGYFAWWLKKNKPAPQEGAATAQAPLVEIVKLAAEDVRQILHGFGTARSDREATIAAEVSAGVVECADSLQEGAKVEPGDVLVRLDERIYRQEFLEAQALAQSVAAELAQVSVERSNLGTLLEIAESDLTLNREELARVERLFNQGNAPKTEYDDARLAYQRSLSAKQQLDNQIALLEPRRQRLVAQAAAAEARAERAQLNIERCQITAPFAGVIRELMVEVGDRVGIGSPLFTLVNLEMIEVPLELPVADRPRTREAAPVVLAVESMPNVTWTGQVARIGPVADLRSRTFTVYVEVDNRAQREPLLPGYFVRAEIDGPLMRDALVVPRNAVVADVVYVANDQAAHRRPVTVERYEGDRAVVSGEVAPGDAVIVSNLDLLFDGAAVRLNGAAMMTSNGAGKSGESPADAKLAGTLKEKSS
jgi:RND family efflux transporter MFP subunit